MRNTPPIPISIRDAVDLVDDLCSALRIVGAAARYSVEGPSRGLIEAVQELFTELSNRRVDLSARIAQLSVETDWQMNVLLDECLGYPGTIPHLRESDGIRSAFRCRLCSNAEFPARSDLKMCDSCLGRTIEAMDSLTPPQGLLFYRTYNASKRCEHADSETVLVAWDDEEFWETGRCMKCLKLERDGRGGSVKISAVKGRELRVPVREIRWQ